MYVVKHPISVGESNTREFSVHEVNTDRKEYSANGMNHLEGGWPKDVDPNEAEHVMRFRKKVEKDEKFHASLTAMLEVRGTALRFFFSFSYFCCSSPPQPPTIQTHPPCSQRYTRCGRTLRLTSLRATSRRPTRG
jgi:hypothetical protein